jgi:hypothetical protein
LLFRDGWTYSATDYEGPEFPPPTNTDELDALTLVYWRERKIQITAQMRKLAYEKEELEKVQLGRDLPLQQATLVEEAGKYRKGYKPVDLSGLETRLAWMREDLAECHMRLSEIEEEYPKVSQTFKQGITNSYRGS